MRNFRKEKRKLIEMVFQEGGRIKRTDAKNTIAEYLEIELNDTYGYKISSKTLVRCYDNIVLGINPGYRLMDNSGWDFLSKMAGYKNFDDFCEKEGNNIDIREGGETSNETLLAEILETLISIKDSLVYAVSHFTVKQANWGVVGIMILGGVFFGRKIVTKPNDDRKIISFQASFCMYWDHSEYKMTSCTDKDPNHNLVPVDSIKLKYFKKITRPDTITVQNSFGKVWYSKYQKKVDFFTMDGVNPDNGKELLQASQYIIEKYGKQKNGE